MNMVEQLETHLHDLYLLNSPYAVDAFKPAFRSFFGEEHQTFKLKMFHNLDQLRLQLERENLHGVKAKTCLQAHQNTVQGFLASKGVKCNRSLIKVGNKTSKDFTSAVNLVREMEVICMKKYFMTSNKSSVKSSPPRLQDQSSSTYVDNS
ncbi:hypothetical protein Tco_0117064 [Tanacetum coccineum]